MLQKYTDDQGGYLAATITYYGFFAISPLLLVLTTVLGFVRLARGSPRVGPPLNRLAPHFPKSSRGSAYVKTSEGARDEPLKACSKSNVGTPALTSV